MRTTAPAGVVLPGLRGHLLAWLRAPRSRPVLVGTGGALLGCLPNAGGERAGRRALGVLRTLTGGAKHQCYDEQGQGM